MKTKIKENNKNNKNGISLIVLVITIIVMIILAAIILSLSSNGIIDRANEAVDKTDKAQVQNLASLAWSEAYLNGARTKEELMLEVSKILKEQGITKADYLLDITENGVEVTQADTWDYAFTCTGGVWSDRIEKGNPANGEIVAKFYKTGNKVKLNVESLGEFEADEYKLVITGKGELGLLYDMDNEIIEAWFAEAASFNPEDENSELPALFGISEVIISGDIKNIEYLQLNQPFYAALTDLTIEDAIIKFAGPEEEDGDFAGSETVTTLKNIVLIGDGIEIGRYAFMYYTSIESVVLGEGVTGIGYAAFAGCTSLESVTIGAGVTSIGYAAFVGCTSLESLTIGNSVTSIGEMAFWGCNSLTSVTIPNSVTSIGESAFEGCSGLTSVTIPNSVTSIGGDAFYGCSGLTRLVIPSSVTSIDTYALHGCTNLSTVYYTGTEEEWNQIKVIYYLKNELVETTIGEYNESLTNANIVYNYVPN